MARGFESKSVADQQEAAASGRRTGVEAASDPARLLKRRKLELARADVLHRLEQAHAPAHRQMLERALAAVDKELATLA